MSNLASTLTTRWQYAGDLADLDRAIELDTRAVAYTDVGHPDRTTVQSNLVAALVSRFDAVDRGVEPLDEAISLARDTLAGAPPGYDVSTCLMNATTALTTRFEYAGDPRDLDEAIDLARQAVATSSESADRGAVWHALASALETRFHHHGGLDDLASAIAMSQRAVEVTPPGHFHRAQYMSTLASMLKIRFEQLGALGDLDEAIAMLRQALPLLTTTSLRRSKLLSNLGGMLQIRYERARRAPDLTEGIELGRQAVAGAPAGDLDLGVFLSNLAAGLWLRGLNGGPLEDLDEAIETFAQAMQAPESDRLGPPTYRANQCAALLDRYERSRTLADLDRAIAVARPARDETHDDPDSAERMTNLGVALRTRHEHAADPADLDESIRAFAAAANATAAAPWRRAVAAAEWGRLAAGDRRWADALEASELAVGLLAEVAPLALPRGDQEHQLAAFDGLAPQAAACALQSGDVERAVELFEQGRGVLLSQALDTRADVLALEEHSPQLAARFVEIRDRLNSLTDQLPLIDAALDETDRVREQSSALGRRRELADAYASTLAEVRDRPGFQRFLLASPIGELRAAARDGPVVLVNVSDIRSDALVLTATGIDVVTLPRLTPEAVRQHVEAFVAALDETAEDRLLEELAWLWDDVAGPVLERLGLVAPPADQPWPRVWWCPSGLLGMLPLHAAGHHDTRLDAVPLTVCDRVVSSNTPTLRALIRARARAGTGDPALADRAGRAVVIAMTHTEGWTDLPAVAHEIASVREYFGSGTRQLGDGRSRATRDAVLSALARSTLAHFACHCTIDIANPSLGVLLLEDHRDQPLTIRDIGRLRLADAELAYLSACSTARTDAALPDEAVHFAAAFQLAGYRHVVATLWPTDDTISASVSSRVYGSLAAGHGPAVALHIAMRRLRDELPDSPSDWAGHLHHGA